MIGREAMRLLLAVMLLVPGVALAQARRVETRPTTETIGTWILSCAADPMTDKGACALRHRLWLEEPRTPSQTTSELGRPGVALEVIQRHGLAVPAVAARDLTMDSARLGLLAMAATAQVRFGREPALELPCALEGRTMMCAPKAEQAETAAAQLGNASTALVRISGAGMSTETLALDLSGTREAIQKFRARAPERPAPPPSFAPGAELRSLIDQLFRGGGAPPN
jgi:hypothetical protein